MGKQSLKRGSDLASVTQPVSGRSQPIFTRWAGPPWLLCIQASYFTGWVSQSMGADSLGFQVLSDMSGGQRTTLAMDPHLDTIKGDMGVPAPEWGPCLPASRQPPLQPSCQGLQGPAAPAGSPTHQISGWAGPGHRVGSPAS